LKQGYFPNFHSKKLEKIENLILCAEGEGATVLKKTQNIPICGGTLGHSSIRMDNNFFRKENNIKEKVFKSII